MTSQDAINKNSTITNEIQEPRMMATHKLDPSGNATAPPYVRAAEIQPGYTPTHAISSIAAFSFDLLTMKSRSRSVYSAKPNISNRVNVGAANAIRAPFNWRPRIESSGVRLAASDLS